MGHRFNLRAPPLPHWNGIVNGEVLVVDLEARLSHSWNASGDETAGAEDAGHLAAGADRGGVLVHMEQSGFRPEDEAGQQGARYGWRRFVAGLERVTAGQD